MTKKILLGGVVGGIVLFLWGALSHMVLGLGEVGIRTISNEDTVLAAMRQTMNEPGFYFFPGMDHSKKPTEAEQKAWEQKYLAGPAGIVVYQPHGSQPMSPKQLLTELVTDIAVALIAAFLLGSTAGTLNSFASRLIFVGLLGLLAGVDIHVPYWNWYGFPSNYTLGVIADEVIGFVLVGIVLAMIVKKPAA